MRILIDLQSCQSGSRLGGIGRYSLELTRALLIKAAGHDVWILLNSEFSLAIGAIRAQLSDCIPQYRIVVFESLGGVSELHGRNLSRTMAAELCRERFVELLCPQFILITSLFEGLGDDVVISVPKKRPGLRIGIVLYDLIPLIQKEKYLADDITRGHYLRKYEQLKAADVYFAISEFSRLEGIEVLKCNPKNIINVSSAASTSFRKLNLSRDRVLQIRSKYGLGPKFLMYVGSFDQRKNHRRLIAAYAALPQKIRKEHQLLLVGNHWPAIHAELIGYVSELALKSDRVVFADKVSDSDLIELYNICDLLVFPSLFEGFGLPILEAMCCGAPAIGSDSTSIPEVIGRPDALFDPESVESIAGLIGKALADAAFRQSLISHAAQHSRNFGWDKSAARVLAAIEADPDVAGTGSGHVAQEGLRESRKSLFEKFMQIGGSSVWSDGMIEEVSYAIAANEYLARASIGSHELNERSLASESLGVVTTWNQKCGIAEYTQHLLAACPAPYHVFAPKGTVLSQDDNWNVHRCWLQGENDDLSELERAILRSGVTAIVVQFNYGFFGFAALDRLIKSIAGRGILCFVEFHSTSDPPPHILNKKLSDLNSALSLCAGLFVHSERDFVRLEDLGFGNNTALVPLAVNVPHPAKVDCGRTPNDFVIAAYGFALPHKGLLELVAAFASLSIAEKKLLLINAEYPAPVSSDLIKEVKSSAARLGVMDKVTVISEYLPDSKSLGYLSGADVIVYPYQATGESSSAAVRMGLAARKPVLVTPLTIFSDIEAFVWKTKSTSVEDLASGIDAIVQLLGRQDPEVSRYQDRADAWLRACSPENVFRSLWYLIATSRNFAQFYQRTLRLEFADPRFKTIVGVKQASGILVERVAGVAVYGPYIGLHGGNYTFELLTEVLAEDAPSFQVLLRHTDGEKTALRYDVDSDFLAKKVWHFSLASPVANFEIQVIASGRGSYLLKGAVIIGRRNLPN